MPFDFEREKIYYNLETESCKNNDTCGAPRVNLITVQALQVSFFCAKKEAKRSIARSDAARGAYYKSVSGKEWGNPHGYELCIDASVGEETAAELICSYIHQKSRQ